ncbi:MAG: ExeM/NucH family extracellular endonuclease [Hydrogenophaga sp.]|uniref:ExeM/NucH family extracellular endonuclease n=1 Tax=Hydrogenophaga sp. TaxID=1904254 RepID=UPI002ABC7F8B|nr:ExeM/NucH family extracellular endonuclease [Hydrogenophaga sp.]MDZ4104341.1 ExeM/NucH family extracellular endonuclease [Hydrogenophaga sp.]
MTASHTPASHGLPTPKRLVACLMAVGCLSTSLVWADAVPRGLPFEQNWSDGSLIGTSGDWSSVPGIVGYRGDALTALTGADPQTILSEGGLVVDVQANQTAPNTFNTGGVAEFALSNPTIALNGSGTADAPHIVIHLNTAGQQAIQVRYTLRDLDGSADNAVMPVALQYRVGNSGDFINVPGGFVADATSGPSLATLSTAVSAELPPLANDQPEVQVRIITANAVGNDEWVGIDDIAIAGTPTGGGVNSPIATTCPANPAFAATVGGSIAFSATDLDSAVNSVALTSAAVAGITLETVNTASTDGGVASAALVVAANVGAGSYPVQVTFANNELQSATCDVIVTVTGVVTIPEIQGSGSLSPRLGERVTTLGVVTKLLNNGFFMQDPVGDGNADTSDGIFVFTGAAPSVAVGQSLRVSGTVGEFAPAGANAAYQPATQLGSATATVLSSGHTVSPQVITLPEVQEGELERFEGMLVFIQTPLTASQNFFQGRYGQVTLGANGRLVKPTNEHPAGSVEAIALAEDNARRRIILDDGTSLQNPNPTPYIGAGNTLRAGDTLPGGLTGVIDYGLATNIVDGLSDYKIHPTEPVVFERANPRPAAPPAVGGNVRVGSFNVLNYFTTLDAAGSPGCFPGGGRSDCRGADSALELERQASKIVPAILGLNADVVGLMEIENNGNTAAQDLVNRLNAVAGAGTYATVAMPEGGTGGDAIRVAMLYKPASLRLVGQARSDTDPVHNRPPLAQTFAAPNGERFSVVVNHFKSKGGCPTDAASPDADQGDGQGCFNPERLAQARALINFIDQLKLTDPDVVVVGDLNAYGKEDPILELTKAGLVDEIDRFNELAYSYVFDGESGYLDHGLSSASLSPLVTGAVHWHINADEPSIIDYNTEFKQPACATCGPDYYAPSVYRSSDHDAVLLGLSLVKTVQGTAVRDELVGTPGDDRITGGAGPDVITGGLGADTFVYTSARDANDRITDFVPGTDRIDIGAFLADLGYTGTDAFADGTVRLVDTPKGVSVRFDINGKAGAAGGRPLLTLIGVKAVQLNAGRDFVF